MTPTLRACAILLCTLAALPAAAQYRCGNVFQDRPCDPGVTEQRLNVPAPRAAPAADAGAASPFAIACRRVGEKAQGISWKREGGATLERQLQEAAGNAEMVETIHAVYGRRGSTPEIRAAVEAECVARREREAQAAELARTVQVQSVGQVPPAARASAPPPATAPAAKAPATTQGDPRCPGLKARRASTESALRAGGSGATMERLQQQRREVEQQMSEAKCW